ncbi:MAG: 16S rRNA (cytidine(1402)-2'-O)-methyltransferase [Victivallaceae bacterium]|nr:16S rRNA (cytidine(1402)-2'-O)-methyltransferase [Victivallaceae bacterium]
MPFESAGKLYIVSTPIGNLDDITYRALDTLRSVDLIAAEDTRHTRKLLARFDIHTPMCSYHAHNEHHKTAELIEAVRSGRKVAVVSDAGTPAIADPGFLLVREAVAAGIEPQLIPGVSALTFAVTAAGLPVDKFAFYGFPPVKAGRKTAFFERLAAEDKTVIIFESPHRLGKTLSCIAETAGRDTPVAVIREATKIHEEILRGTVEELLRNHANRSWKGECALVINPIVKT